MKKMTWLILAFFIISPAAWAGTGSLENPQPNGSESGIGVISGWHCNATRVDIEFNGQSTSQAAYGTSRNDTAGICGKTNTGFSLLFNYNILGPGVHTIRALADNIEFGKATFTVTTLGSEFVTGLTGNSTIPDFPLVGKETTLNWQQSKQDFVIGSVDNSDSASLNGTYHLKRVSILFPATGLIEDTQKPSSLKASGTLTINGESVQITDQAIVNGVTVSFSDTGTITDHGYYAHIVWSDGGD